MPIRDELIKILSPVPLRLQVCLPSPMWMQWRATNTQESAETNFSSWPIQASHCTGVTQCEFFLSRQKHSWAAVLLGTSISRTVNGGSNNTDFSEALCKLIFAKHLEAKAHGAQQKHKAFTIIKINWGMFQADCSWWSLPGPPTKDIFCFQSYMYALSKPKNWKATQDFSSSAAQFLLIYLIYFFSEKILCHTTHIHSLPG